jgi:hypothetical protein
VQTWRWPDGIVICPTCGSKKVKFLENQKRWQCSSHHSKRQFSVKVGTIFEDSPLGLDKWLVAMWLVANCKNEYQQLRDCAGAWHHSKDGMVYGTENQAGNAG